jgi:hypothetical protein
MEEQKRSGNGQDGRRRYGWSQDDEKRYLPRWKVRNRVKFALTDGGDIDECETFDLSCSGACLRLSRSLIPGQNLRMKIFLDNESAVDVNGHVVWNRIAQEGRYAGVVFDRAPLDVHETILNYAFEVDSEDVVKHWFSGWQE